MRSDLLRYQASKSGRQGLTSFLVLLIILAAGAALCDDQLPQVLTGEKYFHTAHELISEAEKSIDIYMYFAIIGEDGTENPVNILINDLIAAKQRGVEIKVFLEGGKLSQNKDVYQKLTQNGIDVRFDTPKKLLHAKTIIIDNRYCITGSTNWTRAAIEDNYEISVLIDSENLAKEIKEYFYGMETSVKPEISRGVSVPYEFLLNPKFGPAMFKDHARNALDLYLLLLRKSHYACSDTVTFDCPEIASQLGYPEFRRGGGRWKKTEETEYYYLKIRKPFQALKSRYNLINYGTLREKKVTLLPIESSQTFILPFAYWDYGYSKSLSFKAKYVYLISLLETSKNKDYPFWFRSNESIASVYNISTSPVSRGFLELERENIVEITRSKAENEKYEDRQANIYKLNSLMSVEEFNSQIDELKKKSTQDIIQKAMYLAALLSEPKDIEKIKTLAGLIQEHGYPSVLEAVSRAARYKKGTGLHSIETVLTLLETTSPVSE